MTRFIVALSELWNAVVLLHSSLRFSKWLLLHYFAPYRFNVSYEVMSVFKVLDSSALQLRQSESYCSRLEIVMRKLSIHTLSIYFAPLMDWGTEFFHVSVFVLRPVCSTSRIELFGFNANEFPGCKSHLILYVHILQPWCRNRLRIQCFRVGGVPVKYSIVEIRVGP